MQISNFFLTMLLLTMVASCRPKNDQLSELGEHSMGAICEGNASIVLTDLREDNDSDRGNDIGTKLRNEFVRKMEQIDLISTLNVYISGNEIVDCGYVADEQNQAVGCISNFPMYEVYVTEFGLQSPSATADILIDSLVDQFGKKNIDECKDNSLALSAVGKVAKVTRKFERNIALNKSSASITRVRSKDIDTFVKRAVNQDGIRANSSVSYPHRRQSDVLDDGSDVARARNEIDSENWLSFIDVAKVKANRGNPTIKSILEGKSQPYAQWVLIRCCLKDSGKEFLKSAIKLHRKSGNVEPRGFFVAGMYGSGKSEAVRSLRASLGDDFPTQINADIVKVYLKKKVGGTDAQNHFISAFAASSIHTKALKQRNPFIYEGSNIDWQLDGTLKEGFKTVVDYRIISPQQSMSRVLQRSLDGPDPKIPYDAILAAAKNQKKQIDNMVNLSKQYPNLKVDIWISKRDASGNLLAKNGRQEVEKISLENGVLDQRILEEIKTIQENIDNLSSTTPISSILGNRKLLSESESRVFVRNLENRWGTRAKWEDLTLKRALDERASGKEIEIP